MKDQSTVENKGMTPAENKGFEVTEPDAGDAAPQPDPSEPQETEDA